MAANRFHYNTVPSDAPDVPGVRDHRLQLPYLFREDFHSNEDLTKHGYLDARAESLTSTSLPDSSTGNIIPPKALAQSESTNNLTYKGAAIGPWTSSKRPSYMRSSKGQIVLACILLLLPLALSAVLMCLIYVNLQPRNDTSVPADTITEDGRNRSLSDNEYYVNYSATRLVFVSSLSSTLALALVPVGMSLFSYATANTLQTASHSGQPQNLPSPYQFELSLRLLGGGQLDLFRYVRYLFNTRRKKIATVPMLHHAAFMLGLMLLLAVCITIVDALLHIKTATVQYNRTMPYLSTTFNPGRQLPSDCYNETASTFACNIVPGGSGAKSYFKNSSEAYQVLANTSDHNYIRLADDGKTAVITTPQSPPGVSFTAQSYASSTVCKSILSLCNPHYISGRCDACQQWTYNCTAATAGVQLSGLFNDLNQDTSSANFMISYYNTSSKSSNGTVSLSSAINGNVWSAVVFVLANAEPNYTSTLDDGNIYDYDPNLDLMANTYGFTYGIFSCNTSLSDVTYYSAVDGSIRDPILSPMNDTASAPFVSAVGLGYGLSNLQTGLNLAGASATSKEDLTYQFSRVLDRTFLGLSSGILPDRQAVSMFQEESKQVAKIPIPEFIALIALNLALPLVGIVLSVWAFVLCRKQGVVDVQARLGMGALVAGLFEDERLNATAKNVDELYAEMRGLPTARVLTLDVSHGNRMFVAVNDSVSQTRMGRELEQYRDVRQ